MLAVSKMPLLAFLASITTLNWFGILLVYGLGLICAATILNLRRRIDLEDHEAEAVVLDIAALPGQEDSRTQNALAFLSAQMEDVATAALPGARATIAPALADLRRPQGCGRLAWLRCLVALHAQAPGLAVVDGGGRLVAVLDFLPAHVAAPARRAATLGRAAIAHRSVQGGFYRSDLVAWLEGELDRRRA